MFSSLHGNHFWWFQGGKKSKHHTWAHFFIILSQFTLKTTENGFLIFVGPATLSASLSVGPIDTLPFFFIPTKQMDFL